MRKVRALRAAAHRVTKTPDNRGRLIAIMIGLGFGTVLTVQNWPTISDWLARHAASQVQASANNLPANLPASTATKSSAEEQPAEPSALGTHAHASPVALPLILVATTPGKTAKEGSARLGTDPRNPQTYAAGALLLNGARLLEIYTDHVVLERAGRAIELYAQGSRQQGAASDDDILTVGGPAPAHPTPVAEAQVTSITEFIRPNPVYVGERLRGLELYAGARAEFFSRSGLVAGDVLVAVNGVSVTDGGMAMEMLQSLLSGGSIQVSVERAGTRSNRVLDGSLLKSASDSLHNDSL